MDKLDTGFSATDIEEAINSCVAQWPDQAFTIVDQFKIRSEHFQTGTHRILFDCLSNFYRNGKPLDLMIFTSELRELNILDRIGGASFVTETWVKLVIWPGTKVMEYYCKVLEEAFARKKLVETCNVSIKEAVEPGADATSLLPLAVKRLSEIPINTFYRKDRTLLEAVQDKIERMENGEPTADIIPTGLIELDRLSPLRRGDMPIISGDRKSGKSFLALNIALNVAKSGVPVLCFSLEDREQKVIDRLFAATSRIPFSEHHVKRMNGDLMTKATKASATLSSLQIHLKDDVYDLLSIIALSRELKKRASIGLIIVDYAQLVKAPTASDENRQEQVAEVSRGLRLLAMELDIPVIVISQLNEKGSTRESKALEQDCTAMWRIQFPKENESEHIRAVVIPFQRNGPSGVAFKVTFLGEIGRFENYESQPDKSDKGWWNK